MVVQRTAGHYSKVAGQRLPVKNFFLDSNTCARPIKVRIYFTDRRTIPGRVWTIKRVGVAKPVFTVSLLAYVEAAVCLDPDPVGTATYGGPDCLAEWETAFTPVVTASSVRRRECFHDQCHAFTPRYKRPKKNAVRPGVLFPVS